MVTLRTGLRSTASPSSSTASTSSSTSSTSSSSTSSTTATVTIGDGFERSTGPASLPLSSSTSSSATPSTPVTVPPSTPARGPGESRRAPAVVVTRTLDDGRPVALREDGSAIVVGRVLRPGLDLRAHGDHPLLQHLAPLVDDDGAAWVLVRGDGVDRLVRPTDGPVAASQGALFVHEGRFLVADGHKLWDGDGALRGVIVDDAVVPLVGDEVTRRQLQKALRDGALRRVDDPPRACFTCSAGIVIDEQGRLFEERGRDAAGRAVLLGPGGLVRLAERLVAPGGREQLRLHAPADGPLPGVSGLPTGAEAVVDGGALGLRFASRPGLRFGPDGAVIGASSSSPLPPAGTVLSGEGMKASVSYVVVRGGVWPARQRHGDELLVRVGDRDVIVGPGGRTRDGAFGAGPFGPAVVVQDGVAFQVQAKGPGGLLCGRSDTGALQTFAPGRAGVRAVDVDDDLAFGVMRGEQLDGVVCGGVHHIVAREPTAMTAVARDVVSTLRLLSAGQTPAFQGREARGLCRALLRLIDDVTVAHTLGDRGARLAALETALATGQGPGLAFIDAVGGADRIGRAFGVVPGDDVVIAFSVGGGRVRRQPGTFQGPGDAAGLALFRRDADGLLAPLTLEETRARFDAALADLGVTAGLQLATAPRPTAIAVVDGPPPALRVHGPSGSRDVVIDGSAGQGHPALVDVAAWLARLPLAALDAVTTLRFGPFDPGGQARFDPAEGVLSVHPVDPSTGFWASQGAIVIAHEVVGHGLEQGDPLVLRALALARALDGLEHGQWVGTDDAYGDTNLAESFAVGVQERFLDDARASTLRPAFGRLVDALLGR